MLDNAPIPHYIMRHQHRKPVMDATSKEIISVYDDMLRLGIDRSVVISMMQNHRKGIIDLRERSVVVDNHRTRELDAASAALAKRIDELMNEETIRARRENFFESLKQHSIKGKGTIGYTQIVTLTESDNGYLRYPVRGALTIIEQGVDLSPIVAVFRTLNEDGTLGVPVETRRPKFTFDGESPAFFKPVG